MITGVPLARTSTAGAAATWRTVTRALPAGTGETSLTKALSVGLPCASRLATSVAFAPAGTATPLASAAGWVPDGFAPAG